jgi:formate dehydrogenase major subunit
VLDNRAHPWLTEPAAATAVGDRRLAVLAREHTDLSRRAELVLPVASWVETEGTYTSSTGRVQLARRGVFPAEKAKPPWEILHLVGAEMGIVAPGTPSPRSVFEELVGEVPAFAGMTYRRLEVEPGVPVLEEVPHVG